MNVVPNKLLGQCAPALPCVNNINDYQCITSGTSTFLVSTGKLLPYPGTASTQPQKLIVAQNIEFIEDYEFAEGTEIIMLAGALLQIKSGVRFKGLATIRGCNGAWYGIRTYANGYLSVYNSAISNSCQGIILDDGAEAEIIGNTFTDNFICVQAEGTVTLYDEGIAHNIFDGTVNTNSCSGIRRAILLNNVSQITIGNQTQTGQPNRITGYQEGITANNSNVDVFNTTFANHSGAGIRLRGTSGVFTANIAGNQYYPFGTLLFDNCNAGIDSRNYNLSVSNAYFRTTQYGISLAESALPSSLRVSGSFFEDYYNAAINILQSNLVSADIFENEMRDNNSGFEDSRYGVHWLSSQITSPAQRAYIHDNKFYDDPKTSPDPLFIQYESYGARVANASRVKFEYNEFYQNYQTDIEHGFKGIWLYNAPSNEVVNNDFYGNFGAMPFPNNSDLSYRAIHVYNSGANIVSCNDAGDLNEGMYFDGMSCDQTDFRHNIVTDNLTGLYLRPGTIIGQQYEKENRWEGGLPANGVAEAFFDGNPGSGLLVMSRFLINSSNTNSSYWANPRIPGIGWFNPTPNEPRQEESCPPGGEWPGSFKSEANRQAIEGIFDPYKGYPASAWEANLNAFATLTANPALRPAGSPEAQFYNTHDVGNVGKLHRAHNDWNTITLFSTALESSWSNNQTDIADKLDDIRAQTELMQAAETEAERQQIAQTLATLNAELSSLQQTNQSLSAQYQSEVTARANQLATDLSAISTTDTWEQNLKTVLSLLVDKLLSSNTDWTTAQRNTLESIADQCRHEGGIGVVIARVAIQKFDYDDEADCPGAGLPRSSTTTQLRVSLAPNPASGFCRLAFEKPLSGQLVVHNFQGQIVRSVQLEGAIAFDLDTHSWASGLYLLQVRTEQGLQYSEKLIVSH